MSLKILLFMKIFIFNRKQYLNEDNIDIIQYFDNYYNDEDDIPYEFIKGETGYDDEQLFDIEGNYT